MAVLLPLPDDVLVVQLVGVAILVAPDAHQRLAGGDGPDPAPEAPLFPVTANAAAHLEEGFLEHVFGVLGGAADPAGEAIDRRFEGAVELPQRLRVPGTSPANDRFGVGEER